MIVAELAAKFGLEVDEAAFAKGAAMIQGLSTGFMGLLAAGGAAIVGLTGIVAATAHVGDETSAVAEKLGVTTQALQGLQHAAIMFDASAEGLNNGLKFIGKNASEAANGSEEMQKAFARAGVTLRGSDGKLQATDVLLGQMADKFAAMGEGHGPEKLALATKLLGRAGAELIPMLNKGSAGINEMRREAERLGLVMSDDVIKASEEWDDSTKRLGFTFVGLRNAIGGPLIRQFTEYVKALSKFVAKNKEAVASPIIKFAKGLGTAIKFLTSGTTEARVVWVAFTALLAGKVVSSLLAAKVGFDMLTLASLKSAAASIRAWVAATGPIILLGAAIALIADDLYAFANGDDSLLGRIVAWTEKIDPEDNNMIKALKKIGAALFDINKPGAFKGLATGMLEAGDELNKAFKKILDFNWVGEAIVQAIADALGGGELYKKLKGGVPIGDSRLPMAQRLFEGFTDKPLLNNPGGMVTAPITKPLLNNPGGMVTEDMPKNAVSQTFNIDARGADENTIAKIKTTVEEALLSQNQRAAEAFK